MTDAESFLPPPTPATRDDWHVLIVQPADQNGDRDVEILHPTSCAVSVHTEMGVHYECHTQHDLDNGGFYGMFGSDEHLETGVFLIAPWVEKIRGFDWTEYDNGWEVHRLTAVEDEST